MCGLCSLQQHVFFILVRMICGGAGIRLITFHYFPLFAEEERTTGADRGKGVSVIYNPVVACCRGNSSLGVREGTARLASRQPCLYLFLYIFLCILFMYIFFSAATPIFVFLPFFLRFRQVSSSCSAPMHPVPKRKQLKKRTLLNHIGASNCCLSHYCMAVRR